MPYVIAGRTFATKAAISNECRRILYETGHTVESPEDEEFLFELFGFHDEWAEKSEGGVQAILVYQTLHGTPCFHLQKHDGSIVDISFPHAVECIPAARGSGRSPQSLKDYKAAARQAIAPQVRRFRDANLGLAGPCPITGEPITKSNCHVDHVAPWTFERLLADFTALHQVDHALVAVDSIDGTVAVFRDKELEAKWVAYHESNSRLRIISARGNLLLPKKAR